MSTPLARSDEPTELERAARRDLRAYIRGVGLALLFTLVPFALVHWAAIPRFPLLMVIGVSALLQVIVHGYFFLHISFRQNREDLQLIVFSILVLSIMVAGTVWIMANLALRMTLQAPP